MKEILGLIALAALSLVVSLVCAEAFWDAWDRDTCRRLERQHLQGYPVEVPVWCAEYLR